MKSKDHFNFCQYLQCSNHPFCIFVVVNSADCWQYFLNVLFKEAAGTNSRQSPAVCLGGGGTLLLGGNLVLVQLGSCTRGVLAVVENLIQSGFSYGEGGIFSLYTQFTCNLAKLADLR